VLDRQLQRALDRGHAGHADDGALVGQLGHQLGEAPALFAAEHVLERHVGVVEEQLAGVLPLLPDLLEDAADAESPDCPRFEQHQRDALGAGRRVGLGHHQDQVGQVAVRDEGLGAVQAVAVAALHGRGADALQVGAGARFRHGDRRDHLAAGQLRQIVLLLPPPQISTWPLM
jgi:hypothetical protein